MTEAIRVVEVLVGLMNWNQKEDTLKCLESLSQVKEPGLKILVVDNASTDGSPEAIKGMYPDVALLLNTTNRGCAGGRNDILKYFLATDIPYLMFLDNDTVVDSQMFTLLINEINRADDIGVVGVKAYYQDKPNVFWSRGGALFNPWIGRFEKLGQKEEDLGQYNVSESVDSVPGGFTFLKRKVAEKVPCIDERYFIYFEDPDWCFRVRKAGFKIATSEKAFVYHKASSSLGMESAYFYYYRTRNRFLFMAKNYPVFFPVFLIYYFVLDLPKTLLTLWLSKQVRQIRGIFLGLGDFFTKRWHVCPHQL